VGAELVQFRFPEGGSTRLVALNGRALPVESSPTFVEHWGVPAPAILLGLELSPGAALEMDVVEHLLRPGELVGTAAFQRPPELAPDITWLSDRAMLRTPGSALVLNTEPAPFSVQPEVAIDVDASGAEGALPAEAPADTLAVPADTVDAQPDSSSVPDTGTVAPDTTAGPRR
jgi:hypothetical protein